MVGCFASPKDVEWSNGKNPVSVDGVSIFAVYMYQKRELMLMKPSDKVEVSLEPFNYELLTVSPVTIFPRKNIHFAPIGLVNMLNTGGAIQSTMLGDGENLVRIGVKGSGEMRVYASKKPMTCKIDETLTEFNYEEQMITVHVPWPLSSSSLSIVEYLF